MRIISSLKCVFTRPRYLSVNKFKCMVHYLFNNEPAMLGSSSRFVRTVQKIVNFEFSRGCVHSIVDFFFVTLVHTCLLYVGIIDHFVLVVYF